MPRSSSAAATAAIPSGGGRQGVRTASARGLRTVADLLDEAMDTVCAILAADTARHEAALGRAAARPPRRAWVARYWRQAVRYCTRCDTAAGSPPMRRAPLGQRRARPHERSTLE